MRRLVRGRGTSYDVRPAFPSLFLDFFSLLFVRGDCEVYWEWVGRVGGRSECEGRKSARCRNGVEDALARVARGTAPRTRGPRCRCRASERGKIYRPQDADEETVCSYSRITIPYFHRRSSANIPLRPPCSSKKSALKRRKDKKKQIHSAAGNTTPSSSRQRKSSSNGSRGSYS
jgi:hypothetical protein